MIKKIFNNFKKKYNLISKLYIMTTIYNLENILNFDEINKILDSDIVKKFNKLLEKQNVVNFTIPLSESLKIKLENILNLSTITQIPMRWIKGDTQKHSDKGQSDFKNTYLIYLNDSVGNLVIDDKIFPIQAGTGYIFNEGLAHETINTQNTERLMIGPMSEEGFVVGYNSFLDSSTDIYISQDTSGNIFYSFNENNENSVILPRPPIEIRNSNTPNQISVKLTTNITIDDRNQYFLCGSSNITYDGNGHNIIIGTDIVDYPGLINNGPSNAQYNNAHSNITVTNINISFTGEPSLLINNGWICQSYFGQGVSNNLITNCSNTCPITYGNSGGICGAYLGANGGYVRIENCYNTGSIQNTNTGGICGSYLGDNGGTVSISNCYNTSNIISSASGGICGSFLAGTITIEKCYNIGDILDDDSGGICGQYAGTNGITTIRNCYNIGSISSKRSGGICGSNISPNGSVTIDTCYNLGDINNIESGNNIKSGGICGANARFTSIINSYSYGAFYGSNPENTATATNCYSIDGSWSDSSANANLTNINTKWISIDLDTPFILSAFDSNLYSPNYVSETYTYGTSQTYTTTSGLLLLATYRLLKVNNTVPSNYITIDSSTGVLSFTNFSLNTSTTFVAQVFASFGKAPVYYGYSTSQFILNVTINANVCFLEGTPVLTDQGVINIDKIIPKIHTIQNKKIIAITKTASKDEYLICFEKNALGNNIPSERTIISKNHLVFNKEKMIKAEEFMKEYKNVHKIKYSNEPLYNVLID